MRRTYAIGAPAPSAIRFAGPTGASGIAWSCAFGGDFVRDADSRRVTRRRRRRTRSLAVYIIHENPVYRCIPTYGAACTRFARRKTKKREKFDRDVSIRVFSLSRRIPRGPPSGRTGISRRMYTFFIVPRALWKYIFRVVRISDSEGSEPYICVTMTYSYYRNVSYSEFGRQPISFM